MLEGEYGVAAGYVMRILVKLGEAHDAERLVDAKNAHVAGGLFMVEIEWYQKLVTGGARFRCFTTLHPGMWITITGTRSVRFSASRRE